MKTTCNSKAVLVEGLRVMAKNIASQANFQNTKKGMAECEARAKGWREAAHFIEQCDLIGWN